MSDSSVCLTSRFLLEEIRSLKRDFETAFDTAVASGHVNDVRTAQSSKLTLTTRLEVLQNTVHIAEAEHRFDLKQQYADQAALLKKSGLLQSRIERDASGTEHERLYIKGIDDKEYPIPSYLDVVERLVKKRELLRTKADQGFDKLLLVPFGMSLDEMVEKFKQYLSEYKTAYDKAHEEDDLPETFALQVNRPVWVWERSFDGADRNGALVYDPASFVKKNHGGLTKTAILAQAETNQESTPAWRVLLLQGAGAGFRGIPRSGRGRQAGTKLKRPDIEAGESPREYLADQLNGNENLDSPYRGEFGMTPEEWIMLFMTHLKETGAPIDDHRNSQDSKSYLIGVYYGDSGDLCCASWDRGSRQVALGRSNPDDRGDVGVRSTVRV